MADPFYLSLEIHPNDWEVARDYLPEHGFGEEVEWPLLVAHMGDDEIDAGVYSDGGVPRIVVYEAYYEWVEALEKLTNAGVCFLAFEGDVYEGDCYRVNCADGTFAIPTIKNEGPAYPVNTRGLLQKDIREQARRAMRAMTKVEQLLNKVRKDETARISRTVS